MHAQIFLEDSLLLPAHERLIDLGALNRVLSDRASMLFENYFDARLELAKVGVLEELSDDIEDDTNTKDYVREKKSG